MTDHELFYEMDLDGDGEISRNDLHNAALRLGWHWPEASIYALLDLYTLRKPLSRDSFVSIMTQVTQDPNGPFGEVLRGASSFSTAFPEPPQSSNTALRYIGAEPPEQTCPPPEEDPAAAVVTHLTSVAGDEAGHDYRILVDSLADCQSRFSPATSALLLIDLQRSFTDGAWLHSLGADADSEAIPIRLAFDNCARLLDDGAGGVAEIFTRCPFPPDSYDWDERCKEIIGDSHPYFIKPGNSVFWPPTNGFTEWLEGFVGRGGRTLIMGGCTLNSCVRISALDIQRQFAGRNLRVVVALGLSGARTVNYLRSPRCGGLSPVESAVREMSEAGVTVVTYPVWE
ncbi:MAG TPA: hypothetical protein VMJ66_13995 [Geobacteraceae bacterium]|nr:hypothetical protein [Geobacteraceae bacterium]